MPKRRRGQASDSKGLREATPREALEAALARAAAAGAAPQEESEEERLGLDEAPQPLPKKRKKRQRTVAVGEVAEAAPDAARAAKRIEAWADDESRVSRWMETRGGILEPQLAEVSGGMVCLRDFFPRDIADSALSIIEALPEDEWEVSKAAGEDDAAMHRFVSKDLTDVPELLPLRSVFWQLLKTFKGEPTMPIFSCGRYGMSDFIGRHDDRAHVPFFSDDNMYSRTVAAIWYLTREWSEEDGGTLLDFQSAGSKPSDAAVNKLVPVYNSLVVFEVPHMHAVSAVAAQRHRYSMFGWWHQKGKRYELPVPVPSAHDEASIKEDNKRPGRKLKKGKRKKAVGASNTAAGELVD